MSTDKLLAPVEAWNGKIYSNGWKEPGLDTAIVTEKATGARLGEIGLASAADIAASAAAARSAQKAWAKLTGPARGDLLREVSRLLLAHSREITDQLIRETGSIPAKAEWEVQKSAREVSAAASLPTAMMAGSNPPNRQTPRPNLTQPRKHTMNTITT
jgi:benzaldehyde dehydrogenase (NAD)